MPLLVISYPEIGREHVEWIRRIRQQHSFLSHSILPPHFTFVFPLADIDEEQLLQHVGSQIRGQARIGFTLRSSLLVKDDSSDTFYTLLVPDEGFSRIVKLHDRLYTELLSPTLRIDLPFIPHITVGSSSDAPACKSLVDLLNRSDFEVEGGIAYLDVVKRESDKVWTLRRFQLE